MKTFKNIFLFVAICSFILFACKKHCKDDNKCEKTKNGIAITGEQEVPPKETDAHGTANVSYNKCDKILTYTISWANLTGEPIGSHIHGIAPRGVNASIKQ